MKNVSNIAINVLGNIKVVTKCNSYQNYLVLLDLSG